MESCRPLIHRQMLARELSIAKCAREMAARTHKARPVRRAAIAAHAALSPHADDSHLAPRRFTCAMGKDGSEITPRKIYDGGRMESLGNVGTPRLSVGFALLDWQLGPAIPLDDG